jgi:hypothetical protein
VLQSGDVEAIGAMAAVGSGGTPAQQQSYATMLQPALPAVTQSRHGRAIVRMAALGSSSGTPELRRAYATALQPALAAVAQSGEAGAIGSMWGTPTQQQAYATALQARLSAVAQSGDAGAIADMARLGALALAPTRRAYEAALRAAQAVLEQPQGPRGVDQKRSRERDAKQEGPEKRHRADGDPLAPRHAQPPGMGEERIR